MPPLFFLSYSRDDAVDPYLDRFYHDLCAEVSIRGGLDLESVGFLDREQPTGAIWPRTTGAALGSCSVFVPVYSPHLFSSHTCGQEWHTFATRAAAAHQARSETTVEKPGGIVPVWWVPPVQEAPAVARYLQDTRDKFGPEYREFGLRYLLQLRANDSLYRDFLVRFSNEILKAAAAPPAPCEVPDLLAAPNAFAPAPDATPLPRQAGSAESAGPRQVTFVVAVGDRETMRVVRTVLGTYGHDWADWRPYHPACPDRVAVRAQGVATAQRMISYLTPADESLFVLLDRAEKRGEMVVLIVDPWSVELPVYETLLARLDRLNSHHSTVLVPWESVDSPNSSEGSRAHDKLYASLGNWMDAGDRLFREDIWSMDEFEKVLGQTLIEIRARILGRAEARRRVTETGPRTRPVLTLPKN
ncbi:TIR-like protein FxsC [Streptomyces sp. NPDC047821]|uniref:TIR-like protein FxsC n=1 Tax=Streptomyces sp. NPDC047821 TaxID=3365488 RepID=UPI0037173F8D